MKVSDKLTKVNESFTVNRYDNGYMVDVSGRTADGDYKSVKLVVQNAKELLEVVEEVLFMEIDE